MKITKEDIKIYLEYGPMEFKLNKAILFCFIIDLPISIITYFIIYFLRR